MTQNKVVLEKIKQPRSSHFTKAWKLDQENSEQGSELSQESQHWQFPKFPPP